MSLEEDPILGRFFNTPEKKAKWLVRIKIAYLMWILFVIIGIVVILVYMLIRYGYLTF
jgi:heme/copper-type cytochrome/quinol oxidase subunit 2